MPAPSRRRLLALLATLAVPRVAGGQERARGVPIRLVVPAPAGGSGDRIARIVADALAGILEVPVEVDNVPGNAGVTGTNQIAGGATDGSLLGIVANSAIVGGRLLSRSARFNPSEDFAWLAILGSYPNAMVVSVRSGQRTLDDWLAEARRAASPLTYGSFGTGSAGHLAGAYLRYEKDVRLVHRTLETLNEGYAQLADGSLDVLFDGVPNALVEAPRSGHPIVAVTSERRVESLPGIPAFGELWRESFVVWLGLVAPKGLDAAAYVRLAPAIGVLLAQPRYAAAMRAAGLTYIGLSGRGTTAFVDREFLRSAKLIARLNDEGVRD
ncbi:MAG: tripartite tricarboxylate transporter substrate binding protein [Burkholderiales bacterium]|nr:tripartite tricarboxylate transporter substrate binding protein [Burkholderiales bacterium]